MNSNPPLAARLLVIGAILRNSLQGSVLLVHDCLTAHAACGVAVEIRLILICIERDFMPSPSYIRM